jgi:DNA-binding response OmpR family regulator
MIRSLLKKVLTKEGYDIIEASDGEQALKYYDELLFKPELVIMGFKLPKIDGLQLTREIRQRDPFMKVLMITGDPSVDITLADRLNIRLRYKPITVSDLITEIDILRSPLVDEVLDIPVISFPTKVFPVQENEIERLLKLRLS